MKIRSCVLAGCLVAQMAALFSLSADEPATNSRQGYPIPVSWEVARLACSGYTLALCIAHDGQTLYSANGDGQVTAWDLKTLTKKFDLPTGASNNIERLVLSQDDSRLASCSGNAIVHVWDTKSGKLIHESHPSENYADVAISADGKTIMTSGLDNPVRVIDVDSGKVLHEFKLAEVTLGKPGRRDGLWNLAFLDDPDYGVGNGPSAVGSFVFDTATGQVKARLGAENIIGLDASRKWLLAKAGSELVFWSLADIKKACAQPVAGIVPSTSIPSVGWAQEAALTSILFDHWNVGNADPSQAKAIDPRQGLVWPLHEDEPPGLTTGPMVVSPDGKFLYQAWPVNVIRVLDLTKRPAATRWLAGDNIHSFAVNAKRGLLATGNLVAWDRNTGLPMGCGESARPYPDAVYWQDGVPFELIQIPNTKTGQPPDPSGLPPANAVSLEKINLQTRQVVKTYPLQAGAHITVGRSGKWIVLAFDSPPVHWRTPPDPKDPRALFNPANMVMEPALQALDGDLAPVGNALQAASDRGYLKVQISPSDKYIVAQSYSSGGDGGQTELTTFDAESGKVVSASPVSVNRATSFAVSDDGMILVTTDSGALSCYRADTGEKVAAVVQAHHHPLQNVAISPDSKTALTIGTDDLIKLWELPSLTPDEILEAASAPGTNGVSTAGFYDAGTLVIIPNLSPNPLCLVPVSQAFDEAKWDVNASAGSSSCLAISEDGKQVAIGELGSVLTVVDNVTGKQLYSVPAHSGGVTRVGFIGSTYQIASYGADGKSMTWDLASSSNPIKETDEKPPADELDISTGTGPKKIFQGTVGNSLTVSPSAGPYQANLLSPHYPFGFERACALPGGAYLALSGWPRLYLYSLKTERLVWAYDSPSPISGLVYDPLHQEIISSHIDGVTRRWELPDWAKKGGPP
jgi:WD40 repeat protein